jgi:aspartate kinase
MKAVAQLIATPEPKIVVLSAMSGTTNKLVEIAEKLHHKQAEEAQQQINSLHEHYRMVVEELYSTEKRGKATQMLQEHFAFLHAFTLDMFTIHEEKAVLAQGELLSTALFHLYLQEIGMDSVLLPALAFMRLGQNEEPNQEYISKYLKQELAKYPECSLFITQGFICRNAFGEIDNLKRGGSDYSASLIGAGVEAGEIQIWTDISGIHNNDPRVVKNTFPIAELSFDEAAELAYFGAKILHPSSVLPAMQKNIPVRLLNTMDPAAPGTLISNLSGSSNHSHVKAVAAKDGITAIKIKSSRMLLAFGFLRSVFEVFERYKTPIDMITTSEVAVSITIDNNTWLNELVTDLEKYGSVELDREQTIVCLVGEFLEDEPGHAMRIFEALQNIPLRMISYGGSKNNISMLIDTRYKAQALQALNDRLFAERSTLHA